MKGTAYVIGRFAPLHKGHENIFLWLLSRFQNIIIGIGSCYEVGSMKHPLLAVFREKMILNALAEKVDLGRIKIVHVPDRVDDWDGWWNDILQIAEIYKVTHFVTGNEEKILGVIREKGIMPRFEMINPETEMPKKYEFGYHATDLRQAIIDGDYETFLKIASKGTVNLMGSVGGFRAIREAMNGNAIQFVPGRQAVDMIVTAGQEGKKSVLAGFRKMSKENFPGRLALPGGAIDLFESPIDAALRELREETGVYVKLLNRSLEPAHVKIAGMIAEMKFVKLFSTTDKKLGGSEGGSSQVFHINLDVDPSVFEKRLKSKSDLERVAFYDLDYVLNTGLAYQQTEMLRTAIAKGE